MRSRHMSFLIKGKDPGSSSLVWWHILEQKIVHSLLFLALIETWDKTSIIQGVSTATTPAGISSAPVTLLAIITVGFEYILFWTTINSLTQTKNPYASAELITCQLLNQKFFGIEQKHNKGFSNHLLHRTNLNYSWSFSSTKRNLPA